MSLTAMPPRLAELLLRMSLKPAVFESVSGDLLEEYRDSVHPTRGRRRADLWYIRQALGFVARSARLWAVLFAACYIARTALDWFVPTTEFHTRSEITSWLAIGIFVLAGFFASWRSGSFAAGIITGAATAAIAAVISVGGISILLAIWHDPGTMAAIRGGGGLEEALTLPIAGFAPVAGILLSTAGGLIGAAVRKLRTA